MTRLSTRTIRNYISMGLLDGEKIDGVWQFTPEQFGTFLGQEMVGQSIKAKSNAMIYDFLLQEKKSACSSCAVIDIPVADIVEEPQLREKLMDIVNSIGLPCSYHYDAKTSAARLILCGSLSQIRRFYTDFSD